MDQLFAGYDQQERKGVQSKLAEAPSLEPKALVVEGVIVEVELGDDLIAIKEEGLERRMI